VSLFIRHKLDTRFAT